MSDPSQTDSHDAARPVAALPFGSWSAPRGYPLRAFLICLIGLSFANMDQALFGYALPAIREEFGVSIETLGWVFSISFAIAGVLIACLGVVTDRIGRKRIFQISIVVSSIFVTLQALAPNIVVLTILRTLGFASGGVHNPVTGTIVVEESPARFRGLLSGILQTGYPIGWFVASLMAAPILNVYGWRPMFLIGLLSIPYIFIVGKYLRETERFQQQRAALAEGAPASRAARAASDTLEPAKIRHLFAPDLIKVTVVLFLGEFLHVAAYGGSAFFLPTYFRDERGFDIQTATLLVGAAYGIGAIGYVISSVVGEFVLTRRNTIVIWSWAGTLMFLILVWGTSSIASIIVVFALTTMLFYGTTAAKFTFLAEHFPTRVRATGVAFSGSLAVNLGLALGPLVVSYAIGAYGWNWAFTTFVAIPLFLSGLVFLTLKPIPSGVEVEEIAT
jgi:MFS family permease